MADILVFIRNKSVTAASGHWMDAPGEYEKLQLAIEARADLTAEQKIRNKEKLAIKFAARSQPGDIIDVKPDGFYCEPNETTGRGWNHHCFALIHCPRITETAAKAYLGAWYDTDVKYGEIVRRKHRFSLSALGLQAGEVRTINRLRDITYNVVDKHG